MNERIVGAATAPAGGPGPNGGADPIGETTTQTFARDVIEASRRQPVLVDFWAPWCGPCRQLTPILEKQVRAANGAVRLMKMNIDAHPGIAGQLGIQSIPAVIAFVDGQPVDGFVGARPESEVKAFIARLASEAGPSDAEALIAEADALLEAGEAQAAGELFAAVLEADREDVRALAGLARSALLAGRLDQARQALALIPEAKASDPRVAAARAQLALAEQTATLGDPRALEAKLAANPGDHQARFDLALRLNAGGDRERAASLLLDIVRKERTWNDEKARKQLLQFFEAWGPNDPATVSGRRRLSSLLFA